MKKIFSSILLGLIICFCLVGCDSNTNKSYTFNVETGDVIKITMNTSDSYNLTSSLPIEFSKDDSIISQGTFIKEEDYNSYESTLKNNSDDSVNILDEGSKNGITYIFYNVNSNNESEYDYVIKIDGSNTAFVIENNISQESAEDIFNRLTFEVQ